MRVRVIIPIIILLAVLCAGLGFAVYTNITSSTLELIEEQLEEDLNIIDADLTELGNRGQRADESDYRAIVEGFQSARGGVFIVDERGLIVADSLGVFLGTSVAEEAWFIEATQSNVSEFDGVYGQTTIYAQGRLHGEELIVSYISRAALNELIETPLYVIGVIGLILITAIGVIIYFLITRLLINPIESFDEQMEELKRGELLVYKPLKRCPEIVSSARQVNVLLEAQQDVLSTSPGPAPRFSDTHRDTEAKPAPSDVPQDAEEQPTLVAALQHAEEQPALVAVPQEAEAKPAPTTFELLALLREAFEPLREQITAKRYQFSMLVANDTPEVVTAHREEMTLRIQQLMHEVFVSTEAGAQIDARVAPAPVAEREDGSLLGIILEVNYNGQARTALLDTEG